jgi:hypothetical protein
MTDRTFTSIRLLKPALCITFGLLSMFARPSHAKPPKNQLVLRGILNCETRQIKIAFKNGLEKSFANLDAASTTLVNRGITLSGINSLNEVLQGACSDWMLPKPSGIGSIRQADIDSPLTGSSLFKLIRMGTEVRFSATALRNSSNNLAAYVTGCSQVTDKPMCFKCPDGTGYCVTKSITRPL